ncbi:MAG: 6-carboxytetrahydropterin synthase [Candidatus Bipolaricaulia bacterium]
MFVWVIHRFDASHAVEGHPVTSFSDPHDHTWEIRLQIQGNLEGNEQIPGLLVDTDRIKQILNDYLPEGQYLNDWCGYNPTPENLAQHFLRDLYDPIREATDGKAQLISLVIMESKESGAMATLEDVQRLITNVMA